MSESPTSLLILCFQMSFVGIQNIPTKRTYSLRDDGRYFFQSAEMRLVIAESLSILPVLQGSQMILASQTCLCVSAGKPTQGQMLSVCWDAKELWNDVGNGVQLRALLQTRAEEWEAWWNLSWLGLGCTQSKDVSRWEWYRDTWGWQKLVGKGVWLGPSSKKALLWDGSWNEDI